MPGQVIEGAGAAGDGQPSVAEVDVGEVKFADGLGAGCVNGGQGKSEAGGRCDGGGGGLADVLWLEWLEEDQGPRAVVDAAGRVAEDRAGFLPWLNSERRAVRVCRRRLRAGARWR